MAKNYYKPLPLQVKERGIKPGYFDVETQFILKLGLVRSIGGRVLKGASIFDVADACLGFAVDLIG